MLIEHRGKTPQVDPTACVASIAVVCAGVRVGADAGMPFGAVFTAEDGVIGVGDRTVVMENAEAVADVDGDRECCGDLPG
jgi:gamma-carbonic anhydrase